MPETAVTFVEFGKTTSGASPKGHLRLVGDWTTAREVIAATVRQAMATKSPGFGLTGGVLSALVPSRPETALAPGDVDTLSVEALTAYQRGDFLFLWSDEQGDCLGQRLPLIEGQSATYLRILPLKGG